MLFEHERRNELTKASSDASLRNQRPRAGFVVCCGAALSAFRALDRTCVLTLIHYWRNESYRMLSIWPTIICQENQVIKIKTGLSTLLRCISATMPKFLHLPADICVKIRRLCRSAMSQTDNPEESSALHFFLVFEEVSSRIEDARNLRIHHGYAEMMDFLIDVANFQTFTETMKNEFSQ